MNRRPNNLRSRVIELERFRPPKGGRFFMIWGRDDADVLRKLTSAKVDRDLQPGDSFDTKIWSYSSEPPPPRWISLAEMTYEELEIVAGGKNHEDRRAHPSFVHWSNNELSE